MDTAVDRPQTQSRVTTTVLRVAGAALLVDGGAFANFQ